MHTFKRKSISFHIILSNCGETPLLIENPKLALSLGYGEHSGRICPERLEEISFWSNVVATTEGTISMRTLVLKYVMCTRGIIACTMSLDKFLKAIGKKNIQE
jgi:hypothetical protein